MDISQILSELRLERDQLDQAIRSLERLIGAAGESATPGGRPGIRLRSPRTAAGVSTAVAHSGHPVS